MMHDHNASNSYADYIADHYGNCDRGSDCYHGTDERGCFNGCLKVGWLGRGCKHWHPVNARNYDELRVAMVEARENYRSRQVA